jgi:hypothetical protein
MSPTARRVLDRLVIEYLSHGRRENGNIIVTYSNFADFGIRRASVAKAIADLVVLGWLDVVSRGGAAYADYRNPSRYALTWLMRKDRSPATNRWKRHKSLGDARRALAGHDGSRELFRKSQAPK